MKTVPGKYTKLDLKQCAAVNTLSLAYNVPPQNGGPSRYEMETKKRASFAGATSPLIIPRRSEHLM